MIYIVNLWRRESKITGPESNFIKLRRLWGNVCYLVATITSTEGRDNYWGDVLQGIKKGSCPPPLQLIEKVVMTSVGGGKEKRKKQEGLI